MKKINRLFRTILLVLLLLTPATAHVGSPGVIFEGNAGPYKIMVNVNPPDVIPGTAQIQVYVTNGPVNQILLRPIYWWAGDEGSPRADAAEPVVGTTGQYDGLIWLMSNGAASIEVKVTGILGEGTVLVPVMAVATAQKEMSPALGWSLAGLGLFLVILMITIVGAGVSDAVVAPGKINAKLSGGKIKGMISAGVVLGLILYGGMSWWNNLADEYNRFLYKPYQATSSIKNTQDGDGKLMTFKVDTSYLQYRPRSLSLKYLVPDHGKLMHMFLMRQDSLDAFAHIHPVRKDSITFEVNLPPLPNGRYFIFADIVRGNGFHETIADTTEITRAKNPVRFASANESEQARWSPSDPDDTYFLSKPVLPKATAAKPEIRTFLPDRSTVVWERKQNELLIANKLYPMNFKILNPDGEPAELEPYMGMMGHAVVMKHDGSVYIHLHPVGNYSTATQDLIKQRIGEDNRLPEMPEADQFQDSIDQVVATIRGLSETARNDYLMELMGHRSNQDEGEHSMHTKRSSLTFPYAFPEPGNYRIWIQMKRNGQILNTAFDAIVQ